MVTRKRHLAKAVSYRFFGSLGTATIAYAATGDARIGISIGAIETIAKIGVYYLHERAWYRIRWGILPDVPDVKAARRPPETSPLDESYSRASAR